MNRHFLPLVCLLLATGQGASAQTFWMQDGRKITMPPAVLDDQRIVNRLAGESVGQPISNIVRLEWPDPPAFAEAEALLKSNRAPEAFALIDATLKPQQLFREIPGSWWNAGAALRGRALASLGRLPEADAIVALLRRSKLETAPALATRLQFDIIDLLFAGGHLDEVRTRLAVASAEARDDASRARLNLLNADLLRLDGKAEEALFAYLRVPVYFPGEKSAMPAALLGTTRCYHSLGEITRARLARDELVRLYPGTPEADLAQKEFPPTDQKNSP